MPLQYQQAWYTFSKGLQQKVDKLLIAPPHLLKAENCIFLKSGSVQKRYGYEKIASLGTEITGLVDFNQTIIAQTDTEIYGYSEQIDEFSLLGTKLPISFEHTEVIRDSNASTNADSYNYNDQFTIIAYQSNRNSSTGIYYSVIDNDGVFVVYDTLVAATSKEPHVFKCGNFIWIVYQSTSDDSVSMKRIPISNPSQLLSEVELVPAADIAATALYDVASVDEINTVALAYSHTTPGVRIKYFNQDGVEGQGVATDGLPTESAVTTEVPLNVIRLLPGYIQATSDYQNLLLYDISGNIRYLATDFNLVSTIAVANWQTISNIERIGGMFDEDTSTWQVMTQQTNANVNKNLIYKGKLTFSGTTTSPTAYQRGMTLASDMIKVGTTYYWWGLHESDIQPTYFLFSDTGNDIAVVSGKHLQGNAGSANSVNHISRFVTHFPMGKRNTLQLEDGVLFSNQGIALLEVCFENCHQANIAQLGKTGIVTGALTQSFDGQQVVEHGFSIFPETLSASQSGASGLADGTYQFVATYSWTDANGDVHESAPSLPISFTVTGGPRNVTVDVPTNRLTTKAGVVVNLYRTTAGGSVFYKTTPSSTGFTFNDNTVDTVSIVDDTADATLTGNPQLYTTGGALENIAPPVASVTTQHKQRMFLAGAPEQPSRLYFSKVYIPGEGLHFSELQALDVELGVGGAITALASLDDSLVVFKRNSIYIVDGLGPDRAGNQNDYQARKINTDVGCRFPQSIVNTPIGVMFKSEKGIYLLDRQQSVRYIGQPVEDFNDSQINAATLHADENHVRFVTSGNEVLYYNYFHDAWSVFTGYNATAGMILSTTGVFYHANSSGLLFKATNSFLDNGANIRMKIRTGWMNFATPLQTKRVRQVALLGQRLEDHRITWKFYHDYSDVVTEKLSFLVTSGDARYGVAPTWGQSSYYGIDANNWGDNYNWGSDSFWGGNSNDVMAFRHKVKQQKTQSISFELTDDSYNSSGPAFTLVGFQLEFAVKQGLKMTQARTV